MYDNQVAPFIFNHLHNQILVMVAVAKTTTSGTCTAIPGDSTVAVQGGWRDVSNCSSFILFIVTECLATG
jgi:hypothetical protein